MNTTKLNRAELKPKTAYACYTGGGIFLFFGECESHGFGKLCYGFSSEDEAVRFYENAFPLHYIGADYDEDAETELMVEDIFCGEIQSFLCDVFDILETKDEHHKEFDNYIAEEIAEIRVNCFGDPKRPKPVEPWLSEQIAAMQKGGQIAINAIDRWLGGMVGFNGRFADDKAMCRMLRRDAIDYEEIVDAESVEQGAKLYWAMDTASRDEFSKIAERVMWELKPICVPWMELDKFQDAITPPSDDDEFDDWADGHVEIFYRDKDGRITASVIVGINAEEIQCIDECISELKDIVREEWGESYRYD